MADSKQKSRYNLHKKDSKKESSKKNEKKYDYGSGSDGGDETSDYESEEDFEDSNDSIEMDDKEYKKFLGKLFPSKFMNKRIKEYEEADKIMDEAERKNNVLLQKIKRRIKIRKK